jgi:hypothetical protein
VSAGDIRGVWQRQGLLTKHEQLLRLEKANAERRIQLTEEQTKLLERFSPEFGEPHIEAPHSGSLLAVDTFFVGTPPARFIADAFVALGHYYLTGIPNSKITADRARARDMFGYAATYFGDADAQIRTRPALSRRHAERTRTRRRALVPARRDQ